MIRGDEQDTAPGGSEAPATGSVSEPRAVDIVSGRASPQDLDPVTLAQLARWFGAPSAFGDTPPSAIEAERAARVDGPPMSADDDPEIAAHRAKIRALLEAADPAFLARAEAWRSSGEALAERVPDPPALAVERPVSQFDLAAWRLLRFDEPREVERPEELSDALEEVTPQAVLRDLHRPVKHWQLRLVQRDVGMDVGGEQTRARIDEVVRTRYQIRLEDEPIPRQIFHETIRDRRERLAEPWERAYKSREERQEASSMPTPDDMYWFGLIPIDDDED